MGLAAHRRHGPGDRDAPSGGPLRDPGVDARSSTYDLALPAPACLARRRASGGEDPGGPRARRARDPEGAGRLPLLRSAAASSQGRLDQPTRAGGVSRAHSACLPSARPAPARPREIGGVAGGGAGPSASRPSPAQHRHPRRPRPSAQGGGERHPAPGSPARAGAGPPAANLAPVPPPPRRPRQKGWSPGLGPRIARKKSTPAPAEVKAHGRSLTPRFTSWFTKHCFCWSPPQGTGLQPAGPGQSPPRSKSSTQARAVCRLEKMDPRERQCSSD